MDIAPLVYIADRAARRAWLAEHHRTESGVWLVYDKGPNRRFSYNDIVEEALCFGWVDSKPGTVSAAQSKLYIARRKPTSAWSKSNKERVELLRANGLMTVAGEAAIAAGIQNDTWDQLNQSDQLIEPQQLTAVLDDEPKARAFYDALSRSSKRIILEWIYAAKTDATREKRVNETVSLALQGIKAHHYRQ